MTTWRRRLVVLLSLLALASLILVTFAQGETRTSNPGGVLRTAGLALSQHKVGGTTCFSNSAAPACDAVFSALRAVPGSRVAGQVVLTAVGDIPATALNLWTDACATVDAAGERFHGGGDLCQVTRVSIHDDTADRCFYPVPGAGACSFTTVGTLAAFAAGHGAASPLALAPGNLKSGITYTVAIEMDRAAGNAFQGRSLALDLHWQVSA